MDLPPTDVGLASLSGSEPQKSRSVGVCRDGCCLRPTSAILAQRPTVERPHPLAGRMATVAGSDPAYRRPQRGHLAIKLGIKHDGVPSFALVAGGIEHDMLDDRVLFQRIVRHIFTDTTLLEAAVGHFADNRQVIIYPDCAAF